MEFSQGFIFEIMAISGIKNVLNVFLSVHLGSKRRLKDESWEFRALSMPGAATKPSPVSSPLPWPSRRIFSESDFRLIDGHFDALSTLLRENRRENIN